jgi:pyruvate decarboxylase
MCLFASQRPVLLGGSKAIGRKEANVFAELAEGIGCGVAVMPGAKGMFDETHAQYIGCYWGSISGAGTQEIVESADLIISCGAIFNDGTSVGWTTLLKPLQTIRVEPNCVMVCGRLYSDVRLVSFLSALAKHVPQKTASLDAFLRYRSSSPTVSLVDSTAGDGPLTRKQLVTELQGMLTSSTALLVESGDAWFIGDELHLPSNAHYHVQMQVRG